jgi:ubiquitin-like 1-activating enzyme E1 A
MVSKTQAKPHSSPLYVRKHPAHTPPDEIALYDRQIRLWGIQAQERIRSSKVLLISVRALSNEVAKNLVLAGIGSITLLDPEPVGPGDLGSQFLLSEAPDPESLIGRNRAEAASHFLRRLNPRVHVAVDTESISSKHMSFYSEFDIVVATDTDPTSLNIINTATRLHGRKFYAAGTHGMFGYIFSDLIEHDYVEKRDLSNVPSRLGPETLTRSVIDVVRRKDGGDKSYEAVTRRELYSTWFLASDAAGLPPRYHANKRLLRGVTPIISCLRGLWDFQSEMNRYPDMTSRDDMRSFTVRASAKHKALRLPPETLTSAVLARFSENILCEVSTTSSILGGQLAQDIINVLSHSQQPIQNMVVFDGTEPGADILELHPEGELGRRLLMTQPEIETPQ